MSGNTRRFPSTAPSEHIAQARCSAVAPRSTRWPTSVVRYATTPGGRTRSATPANDLLPVFMAQEHNDTFHDKYHGIDGGLAVQLPKGINELNQYCLKAFQEYGIPYNPDYNGESQIGVSPVQSTVGNHQRCSAADAYL